MSGHSKWKQIKNQKGVADAKRGNLFTKLANAITVAAREGGGHPDANFKLRLAIDRAKAVNMPKDNIERAIKRGAGELAGQAIEEVVYEAFGPGGSALLIESLTDNKNRSLGEIKNILRRFNCALASINSVAWQFEKKGVIVVPLPNQNQREEIEMKIIEAGASDFKEEGEKLIVYTLPQELHQIINKLKASQIEIEDGNLELVAKETVVLAGGDEEKLEKLLTALNDSAEINNIYLNVK